MSRLKNSPILIIGLILLAIAATVAGFLVVSANTTSSNAPTAPGNWGWWYVRGSPMCPMYGWWYPTIPNQRLDINSVKSILESYVYTLGRGFSIKEIMEFTNNFYAIIMEKDTGMGAFEVLVNPYTGQITPEPGPNMMWNIKYGMHYRMGPVIGPRTPAPFSTIITEDEAKQIAYDYLSRIYPGRIEVEEPTKFYGYYTMDYKLNGQIHSMLSVNEFTGAVWYHSWHGDFIQELELEE
ncbi:MAG: hypothetical protein ABDH32_01460 [Candidatus Caldarchaeales archaeon]